MKSHNGNADPARCCSCECLKQKVEELQRELCKSRTENQRCAKLQACLNRMEESIRKRDRKLSESDATIKQFVRIICHLKSSSSGSSLSGLNALLSQTQSTQTQIPAQISMYTMTQIQNELEKRGIKCDSTCTNNTSTITSGDCLPSEAGARSGECCDCFKEVQRLHCVINILQNDKSRLRLSFMERACKLEELTNRLNDVCTEVNRSTTDTAGVRDSLNRTLGLIHTVGDWQNKSNHLLAEFSSISQREQAIAENELQKRFRECAEEKFDLKLLMRWENLDPDKMLKQLKSQRARGEKPPRGAIDYGQPRLSTIQNSHSIPLSTECEKVENATNGRNEESAYMNSYETKPGEQSPDVNHEELVCFQKQLIPTAELIEIIPPSAISPKPGEPGYFNPNANPGEIGYLPPPSPLQSETENITLEYPVTKSEQITVHFGPSVEPLSESSYKKLLTTLKDHDSISDNKAKPEELVYFKTVLESGEIILHPTTHITSPSISITKSHQPTIPQKFGIVSHSSENSGERHYDTTAKSKDSSNFNTGTMPGGISFPVVLPESFIAKSDTPTEGHATSTTMPLSIGYNGKHYTSEKPSERDNLQPHSTGSQPHSNNLPDTLVTKPDKPTVGPAPETTQTNDTNPEADDYLPSQLRPDMHHSLPENKITKTDKLTKVFDKSEEYYINTNAIPSESGYFNSTSRESFQKASNTKLDQPTANAERREEDVGERDYINPNSKPEKTDSDAIDLKQRANFELTETSTSRPDDPTAYLAPVTAVLIGERGAEYYFNAHAKPADPSFNPSANPQEIVYIPPDFSFGTSDRLSEEHFDKPYQLTVLPAPGFNPPSSEPHNSEKSHVTVKAKHGEQGSKDSSQFLLPLRPSMYGELSQGSLKKPEKSSKSSEIIVLSSEHGDKHYVFNPEAKPGEVGYFNPKAKPGEIGYLPTYLQQAAIFASITEQDLKPKTESIDKDHGAGFLVDSNKNTALSTESGSAKVGEDDLSDKVKPEEAGYVPSNLANNKKLPTTANTKPAVRSKSRPVSRAKPGGLRSLSAHAKFEPDEPIATNLNAKPAATTKPTEAGYNDAHSLPGKLDNLTGKPSTRPKRPGFVGPTKQSMKYRKGSRARSSKSELTLTTNGSSIKPGKFVDRKSTAKAFGTHVDGDTGDQKSSISGLCDIHSKYPGYEQFSTFVEKSAQKLFFNSKDASSLEKEFKKILDKFMDECLCCFSQTKVSKNRFHSICHRILQKGVTSLSFQDMAYMHRKIFYEAEKLFPGCLLTFMFTEYARKLCKLKADRDSEENLCCQSSYENLKDKVKTLVLKVNIVQNYIDSIRPRLFKRFQYDKISIGSDLCASSDSCSLPRKFHAIHHGKEKVDDDSKSDRIYLFRPKNTPLLFTTVFDRANQKYKFLF